MFKNINFTFLIKYLLIIFFPLFTISASSTLPEIYVSGLQLNKEIYKQGETVDVSFLVSNTENMNITDLYYSIDLMGDFDETDIPRTLFSSEQKKEKLKVNAKQELAISDKFTLPTNNAGDLGIRIRLYVGNSVELGWETKKIKVDGKSNLVNIDYLDVIARDIRYSSEEGPTVYTEEEGFLAYQVTPKNQANLKEVVKIVNRDEQSKQTEFENPITLTKGKKFTNKISLPTFANTPGVYEGIFYLADATTGEKVTEQTTFRYIVAGDIANILSLETNRKNIDEKFGFKVFLSLTGNPLDISDDAPLDSLQKKDEVNIIFNSFDEKDRLVFSQNFPADLAQNGEFEFDLMSPKSFFLKDIEVIVEKDGKMLAAKKFNISSQSEIGDFLKNSFWNSKNITYLLLILLLLVIAAFLLYKKKYLNNLLLVICFAFIFQSAQAYTITNVYWVHDALDLPQWNSAHPYPAKLFVNKPVLPICTGAVFKLEGRLAADRCSNQPQEIYIKAIFRNVVKKYRTEIPAGGGHEYSRENVYFSLGNFTAPPNPGTYRMNIGYASIRVYKAMGDTKYGYENIEVKDCTPDCTNGAINPNACNQCPAGTEMSGGRCVCSNGATNFSACNICPAGSHMSGGQCICSNGTINFSACNVCPTGQSIISGRCACTNNTINPPLCDICPIGSSLQGGQCTCDNGAHDFPACGACPLGQSIIGGSCACTNRTTNPDQCDICPVGTSIQNGRCECTDGSSDFPTCNSCPLGQSRVNNICTCDNGTTNPSLCDRCPDGSSLIDGQCSCANGATKESYCLQCPAGETMHEGACTPECTVANVCGINSSGVMINGVCDIGNVPNVNDNCLQSFGATSDKVSPNGSTDFLWDILPLRANVSQSCNFADLTTGVERPIPGLQNLDHTVKQARITNIRETTRFCLTCQFYNTLTGEFLGDIISHQWIKVTKVVEN